MYFRLKQNILHSSQVLKPLGCFFTPERRTNNEFTAQNPLEEAKIIRKEASNAGAKLRKSSVAVGQSDENDRKSAESCYRRVSETSEKQAAEGLQGQAVGETPCPEQ